ncbi:DUF4345 domain-containing protein [Tellurirhabdus rosea]|uniref:DUF4345 domain-containing protein n=1 Tax=Tellurirhabdus rosea TaxID=2674997 RepID=UPI00224CD0A7|nr:DUF4345 domain-containing protein [Tellurirhabdus rosea]
MNTTFLRFAARFLIGLATLGIFMVAVMAFQSPQAVMDLVQVKLTTTDAYSSIRGVYGGAGLSISVMLVYLGIRRPKEGLAFVALITGLYALSRWITAQVEGPLGAFGQQWIVIEGAICVLSLLVLALWQRAGRLVVA